MPTFASSPKPASGRCVWAPYDTQSCCKGPTIYTQTELVCPLWIDFNHACHNNASCFRQLITILDMASFCTTHSVHWWWAALCRKGHLWPLSYPADGLKPLSHQSDSFSLHLRWFYCGNQGQMTKTCAATTQKHNCRTKHKKVSNSSMFIASSGVHKGRPLESQNAC